jgi:hypothetical protein
MTDRKLAEAIVKDICKDFQDRRGLRQQWDTIDADTQKEIIETWTVAVEKRITKSR